jgi:hypothetical protein
MDKNIINRIKQYKYVILLICLMLMYFVYRQYFEAFNMDKTMPIYIASKSFVYMCDHYTLNPYSESTDIPNTYPIRDGDKIYIHNTALGNFANNYLPNIKYKFILLSGDTDRTIPDDDQSNVNTILNNPLLIIWYSQNCTKESEKLKQLPIGLDYHTLANDSMAWGNKQSLKEQEDDIITLLNMNVKKINKCYANYHLNMMFARYGYDRYDAKSQVPEELVYYEPHKIPRIESWTKMINYKYVISPLGNGLDCHRTWEAIVLGCIPIVKSSVLDPLYNGLPVLIVKNWSDINQDLLDKFIPDYNNIEKIKMKYWIDKFNNIK